MLPALTRNCEERKKVDADLAHPGQFFYGTPGEFVWDLLQGKDVFLETQASAVDRPEIGGIEAAVAELL